ncbi:hypothetical protein [Planotetraspora phitsanulokensis]|uniref:Uncharacterized protein n=1 Tax=Planotetraspora phitsanulokensis TaxID=575192 RepID=A0A8J3XCX0_9ACTN|nr:hypothetical protein [Planotetraspora phitsanulokensis]GII36470.1 hypothetical protein Pph01_14730 [Planotetraspora phitsanulokensis]
MIRSNVLVDAARALERLDDSGVRSSAEHGSPVRTPVERGFTAS